jgi:hypothetical protein
MYGDDTLHLVRLSYQPPASSTFLLEQTSHHQPISSTFLSEEISTSQMNMLLIVFPHHRHPLSLSFSFILLCLLS